MKTKVKKGGAQASAFAAREQARKQLWTIKVVAYTQQEILDAVTLVLHEAFGFGPDRQKKFCQAFDKKYAEIQALRKGDDEYAEAKIEEALKAACGENYDPREKRYDLKLITPEGEEIKL